MAQRLARMHRAGRAIESRMHREEGHDRMPVNLAALRKKKIALDVDYHGENIHVCYWPHAIDDGFIETAMRVESGEDKAAAQRSKELLLIVLATWDITEDGKAPLAITLDSLALVGPIVRAALMQAIVKDAFPDAAKGGASS